MASTLTSRFAAIQVKMLHLQFRMKAIYQAQESLSKAQHASDRERIRGHLPACYTFIDMLLSFKHVDELVSDMFATPELRSHFDEATYKILNHTRKTAQKWRPVRNCLGGHIDIDAVERMCTRHGYRGVFLSDDLECDLAVLSLLVLEEAINSARPKSDILGRDLDMRADLAGETAVLVNAINDDWKTVFGYFEPLMKLLYRVGEQEKIAATSPGDRHGIVAGD